LVLVSVPGRAQVLVLGLVSVPGQVLGLVLVPVWHTLTTGSVRPPTELTSQ